MTKRLETEYLPVEALEKNTWNPNAMDAKAFSRLCKEIQEVGFLLPIQVVPLGDDRYRILGGEHRVEACKELGIAEVPAVILEGAQYEDESLQKLLTVRLNALSGKLDPARMAVLYEEVADKYGAEQVQELFAFTDEKAWKQVMSMIKKGLAKSGLPKDIQKKFDEETRDMRTVEDLGLVLNNLFAKHGDTVSQSYMIFTYGKKNHVYLAMTKEVHTAIKKIAKYCESAGEDMNNVLAPALKEAAAGVKPGKSRKKKKADADPVEY